MAKLTAAQRKKLPAKSFAGKGRSFPVNDRNHARAALSMLHNAPKSEQAAIKARAKKVLGTTKKKGK